MMGGVEPLTEETYRALVRRARQWVHDGDVVEPADLVHSAWLRCQPARAAGREITPEYLSTALQTAAYDLLRRERRRRAAPLTEDVPARDDVAGAAANRALLGAVLARAARDPLVADAVRHAGGWTQAALAARRGVQSPAITKRLQRTRNALAREFGGVT